MRVMVANDTGSVAAWMRLGLMHISAARKDCGFVMNVGRIAWGCGATDYRFVMNVGRIA